VEPAGRDPAILSQPRIPTIHTGNMSKMDSIDITGISVDEAVKEALEQLGASEDEVSVQVLVTPRVGVLGLGTRYAKVRVTRKSAQAQAKINGGAATTVARATRIRLSRRRKMTARRGARTRRSRSSGLKRSRSSSRS